MILADPDYLAYERLLTFLGASVDRVDLHLSGGSGGFDPAQLLGLVTDETRCIVLSNPNNPTGAVLSAETIDLVAEVAREHDLAHKPEERPKHAANFQDGIPDPEK